MSSNFQNHSSPCAFAETLVAYLYDECNTGEKIKFEAHLSQCVSCTDELAGFGLVRSAVLDWRTENFSKLETPLIEIPMPETEKTFALAAATESRSWLGKLRNIFSFNPAMAAALGFFVISTVAAFYIFTSSGSNEIADRTADENLAQAITSPTVETKKSSEVVGEKAVSPEKSVPGAEIESSAAKTEKRNVSSKSVVKVSTVEPKNNPTVPSRAAKESVGDAKKSSPVKKQPIPNLNDADEDDADETLRLADLFAELDTKE